SAGIGPGLAASRPPLGATSLRTEFIAAVAWRGPELYVASGAGTIEQWDPATGATVRVLVNAFSAVHPMVFAAAGYRLLVSGFADGTPRTMAYDPVRGRSEWVAARPTIGQLALDRQGGVMVADALAGVRSARSYDAATGAQLDHAYALTGGVCDIR